MLPNTWIVVRIDGRGFHKLSDHYKFSKPNDTRALHLMNAAAAHVVRSIPDICFAYGVSDEFSFVFDRATVMFDRRRDKLVSTVVSTFTAAYLHLWPQHFVRDVSDVNTTALDLLHLPTFDGRAVIYPSSANLRDYLSWRQVDCHINNLYNTTFWTLVERGGLSQRAAEEELKTTVSGDKNEILFARFGINYNNEPKMFRKGSIVYREYNVSFQETPNVDSSQSATNGETVSTSELQSSAIPESVSKTQQEKLRKAKAKATVVVSHMDIIKDDFWNQRPWILSGKPPRG